MSTAPSPDFLARYLRWRRPVEVAAWVALFAISAAANSIVVTLDLRRQHLPFQPWEPFAWEWTSNLTMLALVPAIIALERRMPLRFGVLRRHLAGHLVASVAVSVVHVVVMVALREMVYAAMGSRYQFGSGPG